MSAQSYRHHIETDHPLVAYAFGDPPHGIAGRANVDTPRVETLETALRHLRQRFVYRSVRGRTGFDQLLENLRAATPGERSEINCYDLSCLLASYCRISGWSAEDAFVVFCDRRLSDQLARVDFHACNLLRIGGETYWVEPERLEVKRWTGEEILQNYKVRLVFNDKHIYFTEDEKRRVVTSDIPAIGQQVFLYGRGSNETQAIYNDPKFQSAITGYFESGLF